MDAKTAPSAYGDRGAGGKFRKPPARKPPSTPYDRPPPSAAVKGPGWLSKFVDPAYRLLAGGATKILPSFFSPARTLPTLTTPDDPDTRYLEVAPPEKDDGKLDSSAVHISSEAAYPSEVLEKLKRISEPDERGNSKMKSSSDDNAISRIEQLIKGKTFSRDEINHLMGILNSRTLDVCEAEQDSRKLKMATTVENEGLLSAHQGKQEDDNRAVLGTPLPQSNVGDKVGASPIDIAKAYMGSRNFEPGPAPLSNLSKAEETTQLIEFTSKSPILSPSTKALPCWPGAMVPDQHGYATPLSHRGRYGLHDFPRTPYSRTAYSKSRAKLIQSQADSRFNSSTSNFFQPRTPIYGQAKTRNDVLDDGYGSVGPIRRMRNKAASETRHRGSIFSKPLVDITSGSKVAPSSEKNLEPGETNKPAKGASGSEQASLLLSPSTSQAVKRILEHLDKNKPTPKEKAAELKLATAWRKSVSSQISDDTGKATTNLPHDKNSSLISEDDGGKTLDVQVRFPEVLTNEAKNSLESHGAVSGLDGGSGLRDHVGSESSSSFKRNSGSQIHSSSQNTGIRNSWQKETSKHQTADDQGFGQNHTFQQSKKPIAELTGSKPTFPSISISKPDPSCVISSENGIGFTFPVSASFGLLTEPPTPSIMPSSSSSVTSLPTTESPAPSYSFGGKRSLPRLVFSFPAESSLSSEKDATDLEFKFGSEKNSRLSFKFAGKGTVCF